MERKKILYWVVQIIGWTAYFLFSILLLSATEYYIITTNFYLYAGLSILSAIVVSHGIRFVIIKQSLLSKGLVKLIGITLLLTTAAGFALEGLQIVFELNIEADFVLDPDYTKEFELSGFLLGVSRSIILFLLWSGFYYVFAIVEKSRAQEILNLKWEASKNEIELKNLRAQLNPHFLFNSLNSIRALIGINPDQAKTSVTQLSTLLRRSINLGKMRVIPLKEELDLVKIYLDLEQVRFEERLKTDFQIAQDSLQCEIPPLMVQTIVENGIKHGISKSIDGGTIRVISAKTENGLEITISSSGKLNVDPEKSGIGISNSKKRLEILFGNKAFFDIYQDGDNVVVKINISYT